MNFKMDHIVINVVDIERMLYFYTEILQLDSERLAEFSEDKVPFPSVRLSADTIIDLFPKQLWEKSNPDQVCRPNLNHFCLTTNKTGWDMLRNRLGEHGIPVDEGPVKRWGAHGSGTSIYVRDPEDNVIEIRYYDNEAQDHPCLLDS